MTRNSLGSHHGVLKVQTQRCLSLVPVLGIISRSPDTLKRRDVNLDACRRDRRARTRRSAVGATRPKRVNVRRWSVRPLRRSRQWRCRNVGQERRQRPCPLGKVPHRHDRARVGNVEGPDIVALIDARVSERTIFGMMDMRTLYDGIGLPSLTAGSSSLTAVTVFGTLNVSASPRLLASASVVRVLVSCKLRSSDSSAAPPNTLCMNR